MLALLVDVPSVPIAAGARKISLHSRSWLVNRSISIPRPRGDPSSGASSSVTLRCVSDASQSVGLNSLLGRIGENRLSSIQSSKLGWRRAHGGAAAGSPIAAA